MTTKLFRATRSQKILIFGSAAFALLFSVAAFLFWRIGKMPIYVGLISVIILLLLVGRYAALTRFPVVEVRENQLNVFGWFGGKSCFDLSTPIEVASGGDAIVLKQGKSGAGLSKYVIGKEQFDEVIGILSRSAARTNE